MNCEQCQTRIVESLAAGVAQVSREVFDHQQTCPVCRDFHEAQASLFRSMDASLHGMVNQAMPPSLLPGVRARLSQEQVAGRGSITHWSFALVAAAVLLAVAVGYVRHRSENHPNFTDSGKVASGSVGNSGPTEQTLQKPMITLPSRARRRAISAASPPTTSEPTREVIVLAEERQAFARFVAELPKERQVALALTQPAPAPQDVPVETALLQIESLELRPLEGTPRE